MKLIINAIATVSLVASLTGCITNNPDDPRFQALRGKELYAQVNSFFTSIDRACQNDQNVGSPYCARKGDYVWTGALVGQHAYGTLQKAALAVPKAADVHKGDIIAYHIADGHPWGIFDKIVARSADQTSDSPCRWDGSHFWSGGVICNGWRWDKDYSFLAD